MFDPLAKGVIGVGLQGSPTEAHLPGEHVAQHGGITSAPSKLQDYQWEEHIHGCIKVKYTFPYLFNSDGSCLIFNLNILEKEVIIMANR